MARRIAWVGVLTATMLTVLGVAAAFGAFTTKQSTKTAAVLRAALALTPRTALTGEDVIASFKGSSVPRGSTLRRVTIKWGDNTRPVVLHALSASPKHRYASPGRYTVQATVTGSTGKSAIASHAVKVVTQTVYWDRFWAQSPSYQVESTPLALTSTSTDTMISGNVNNGLRCTSGMTFDRNGRLWVLSYPSGCSAPDLAEIRVFNLPLNSSSTPVYTFTLPGMGDDDNLTFDRKGNLWVEDYYNKKVYEFPGPFTDNTTLVPSLTLSLPNMTPSGLALDAKGDLFVSNVESTSTRSIAMYRAPIAPDSVPKFLDGLSAPGGLIFDTHGDLYASSNSSNGKGAAIVRYNAGDLKPGAKPSVVNRAGLKGMPYESNFAWDVSGNLYVADCGSVANVREYPLATKSFTAKLPPSVTYRAASFSDVECVWGLAIR